MHVIITQNAENNLGKIYAYHSEYSSAYAESFHDELSRFIVENLAEHPRMGHVHNREKQIFRLIYQGRYNTYYTIDGDQVFVLFIIDGRLSLNAELAEPDVELPPASRTE
jgi:plasmid stabilization system protein ParE